MKNLISLGTFLFITFLVAITALGLSIFSISLNKRPAVVEVPAPVVKILPTASASATVAPTEKVTATPTKVFATPTVATTPAE